MKRINVNSTARMRATLRNRVRMFDNDWEDQLEDELKRQFHEKTFPKVRPSMDTTQNIFHRIVRDTCSVYREPAQRVIQGVGENVQTAADELYRSMRVDQTMAVAHQLSKAATCAFLLVRPREEMEDGTMNAVLRVITPDCVYVETDPVCPSEMELFAYSADIVDVDGKPTTIWIVHTDEERWIADHNGEPLTVDPRSGEVYETENPWGTIPAVPFPCQFQIRDFWAENWNRDAAEANLKIGMLSTYLNYLVKTQSFKQIVIGADKVSEDMKDQILDPLFPLLLGGGAQATTIDLNTRLEAIDQVIRSKVSAIANNYGISNENFTLSGQVSSGFALKIANQALQDIRVGDIPLCSHVEQELFRVIAIVTGKLPADAEIQLNPGEVSWPEEWPTQQSRWEFEFKNGISSPVDYVISQDPQKTREEAMAEILKRQDEIKQLKPRVSAWDMILGASAQGGAAPVGPGAPSPLLAVAAQKALPDPPKQEPAPQEAPVA